MTVTRSHAFVMPADAAEVVELPAGGAFTLLADASHTSGALGANRLSLGRGRDGARPHFHALSTELFHVLAGDMEFLLGDERVTVSAGGLVVVPPGLPHAFGAAPGAEADVLVVLTPGIERFEYFRRLGRVRPFDDPLSEQDRYDVHFVDDAAWQSVRNAR